MLLVLTGVSVAGLLSMHGLDPVMANLAQPAHASHSQPAALDSHGAIGLCVFVAALTGVALAAARRLVSSTRPASSPFRTTVFATMPVPRASGPPLLHRLCVLRL